MSYSLTAYRHRLLGFLIAAAAIIGSSAAPDVMAQGKSETEGTQRKYAPSVLAQAESILEAAGLRRQGASIVLADQGEQLRNIAAIQRSVRGLTQERKTLEELQLRKQQLQANAAAANRSLRDLSLRGAGAVVTAADANRMTALSNALIAQMRELQRQEEELDKQIDAARAKLQAAEDVFVTQVLEARRALEESKAKLAKLYDDRKLKIAFEVLATEYQTPREFDPDTVVKLIEHRVANLEKDFIRESVELIDDGGRTRKIAVSVNDAPPVEMILDSGADLILLPKSVADRLGVRAEEDDPRVLMGVADGRTIPGRLVRLSKVRVGKFEVSNVEAAVLDVEGGEVEPLLGMSFLNNFQFKISAGDNKLWMTQVDGGEPR